MTEVYSKAVASISSNDDEKFGTNGGFTAILSTPSKDRDGDQLHRDEWDDLPEWLPLDVDHGMSMADTIGKFHPYWDGDRMMMDAYYASTEKAQNTRTLINDLMAGDGSCPVGVSVAFMSDKSHKDGVPRRELLNAGIVAIPSNRDAVILTSKAASFLKEALAQYPEGEVPEEIAETMLGHLESKAKPLTPGEHHADPGYLDRNGDPAKDGNGVPRYQIDDAPHVRDALGRFSQNKDKEDYTPKQRQQVYDRIIAAAHKFGIKVDDAKSVENLDASTKAAGGDAAMVQAIHDASVHLGSQCVIVEPVIGPDSKAYTDPRAAIAGVDAIIDEAVALSASADRTTLPEPVAQALDLLVGAKDAIGALMKELGIFDPDEKSVKTKASVTVEIPDGMSIDQFQQELDKITSSPPAGPTDSPAEEPASQDAPSDAPDDVAPLVNQLLSDSMLLQLQDLAE